MSGSRTSPRVCLQRGSSVAPRASLSGFYAWNDLGNGPGCSADVVQKQVIAGSSERGTLRLPSGIFGRNRCSPARLSRNWYTQGGNHVLSRCRDCCSPE